MISVLLQEEKEQLIEYRSTVASLVGRAKTIVQLRPRSAESTLGATTPIKAICDYRQIEVGHTVCYTWWTCGFACCPLPLSQWLLSVSDDENLESVNLFKQK